MLVYHNCPTKMGVDSLIRITSWNVAGQEPGPTPVIDHLFEKYPTRLPNLRPEIEIVGLQEAPQYLLKDPWTENLSSCLQKRGYILYKRHKLSGILLYIFVLREIIFRIRDFETESVRTGFGGLLGNKGGVSLRFNYNGNTFAVTNSHLAAHQERLRERVDDHKTILEQSKFLLDKRTPSLPEHEYSFWFGDLNFRFNDIDADQVLEIISNYRNSSSDEDRARIISKLYDHDQLTIVKSEGSAFANYTESQPKFLPTYKYQIGKLDDYDTEKRIPAWTDRVLYRQRSSPHDLENGNFTLKLEQLHYDSIPGTKLSDHKPISSIFKVALHDPKYIESIQMPYEIVKFEPVVGWKERQDGRLWYKISDELFERRDPKVLSSWDRIALYRTNFSSLDQYLTFIYPSNKAKIAPRQDAPDVPYHSSRDSSRSGSPTVSRQASETSISQATEAITLNEYPLGPSPVPSQSAPLNNPIVEDGNKYFSATFPDEVLIPGMYVVIYLKVTDANEYNVYGISDPFSVSTN